MVGKERKSQPSFGEKLEAIGERQPDGATELAQAKAA